MTVAALVTNGSTEQLVSHLRLARQNGLTDTELVEAIVHLTFYKPAPTCCPSLLGGAAEGVDDGASAGC